jgi:hypothetical protein
VQAAFDSVWKCGLKRKIKDIGLSPGLERLLFSFLDERYLQVHCNSFASEPVRLDAGTPQGACISPILYIIFVNDMLKDIDEVCTSQYADDVGCWVTSPDVKTAVSKIQSALQKIENWCRKWHVSLHPAKSKVVVFTHCPRHKMEPIDIKIFGAPVPVVDQSEFLGITMDSRLTWEPQTRKILERAYSRLNLLRAIAGISLKPNPDLMVKLYTSIIRPIFEYPAVCLISSAEVHLHKLQVLQNHALRAALHVPAYVSIADLHDASGIKPIKEHLISFSKRRLESMKKTSPIISETLEKYEAVKYNTQHPSPLDITGPLC